ncbi:MAG TPA: SDR family oxidoreductase [Alphaproteobacteria bacterium]|nr:SDR family oxidoreductase [Alphaproteobacteria bacterium]
MLVITGAGGQLGRAIAHALAERVSPATVTLGSRDPAKLGDLAAKGFRTRAVDFNVSASLESVFDGAEAVLIISGDAPADVRIRQHRAAIDAAKQARVGRVVYTSFTNPTPASLFPFAAIHADSEAYLKASGLPYTILRNNQYAENINGALAGAKATGTLALPGAAGKVAHITRADIAAATAGALTQPGHAGKTYELTGPEALNLFDIAPILTAAWGKPVTATDMDSEAFAKLLAARGVPAFAVDAVVRLRRAVAAGEYAAVSPDAAHLAGLPIEPMSAYARRI